MRAFIGLAAGITLPPDHATAAKNAIALAQKDTATAFVKPAAPPK